VSGVGCATSASSPAVGWQFAAAIGKAIKMVAEQICIGLVLGMHGVVPLLSMPCGLGPCGGSEEWTERVVVGQFGMEGVASGCPAERPRSVLKGPSTAHIRPQFMTLGGPDDDPRTGLISAPVIRRKGNVGLEACHLPARRRCAPTVIDVMFRGPQGRLSGPRPIDLAADPCRNRCR